MTGRISRIHWLKYLTASLVFALVAIAISLPTHAQEISVGFGDDANLTERAVQLVILLTVLSLAPSILVMVTSFTRIVVVLSLLRSAIGLQTAPPNMVMVSLALFLSAFIMMPTLQAAYDAGIQPLIDGDIEIDQAYERASEPFRDFMLSQVREKDLMLFQELSGRDAPETPEDLEMAVLIPAFMISELRRAFEIGFLLYLPFLIIDLVIASVLMSMGMMMLPPVVISLPFKLIFFVLVDGWNLVAGSLVKSFGGG
jgi:flagellar biosynthetic protein FliP